MLIGFTDSAGNPDGDSVPTELFGVIRVEVVLRILAVTAIIFDDVLVAVADDDGKITVLFHSIFGHRFQCAMSAVTVETDDAVDNRWA